MNPENMSPESKEHYEPVFNTYYGSVFLKNEEMVNRLAQTYVDVFNAQGEFEWGEDWGINDAKGLIQESLSQRDSKNFVTIMEDGVGGDISGFSLAHIGFPEKVLLSNQMPKDLNLDQRLKAVEEIRKGIAAFNGEQEPILYSQDLGIIRDQRSGSKRVAQLMEPMFSLAISENAHVGTFWTSTKSRLYLLSKIVDTKELFRFEDMKDNVFLALDTAEIVPILRESEERINQLLRKRIWSSR